MKKIWRILIVLFAIRLVLMAVTPVFDPSEARYAAIAANMARTGDYIVPHFTYKGVYQSFDGKPPLVFQAGGLCCEALGVTEFAVRLFPFLSALLVLLILHHTVRRFADGEAADLAVLICATSAAFYISAGLSMTDMSLTACVAGALLMYRSAVEDAPSGSSRPKIFYALAVGALLGAGMLVKGPVALVMFGLPVLIDARMHRRWRELFRPRWLAAFALFVLIATPWFVLVERRNPGSVLYFFYNENFLRFVSHDYGDRYGAGREAFRGVSILWTFVATLPWVLIPVVQCCRRRFAVRPSSSFYLLSLLAVTGFWCLTSRVLLYYLIPVIPLFAAELAVRGDRALLRRCVVPAAAIAVVAAVGIGVGGMFFSDKMQGARTPYSAHGSTYSYEFYHGTHPEALGNAEKK